MAMSQVYGWCSVCVGRLLQFTSRVTDLSLKVMVHGDHGGRQGRLSRSLGDKTGTVASLVGYDMRPNIFTP